MPGVPPPNPQPAGAAGAAGDDPFNRFYQRELPAMVSLAAAVTGTHLGAEDLAQEALVQAWRNWDRVSTLDKPGAWLRRVTINLALSGRRRAASELRTRLRLAPPTSYGLAPSPAEHAEVWAAVGRLPANQRAAVALHYLEDQPVAAIADILGCAEATARVHLHRGRTALARALEGAQ